LVLYGKFGCGVNSACVSVCVSVCGCGYVCECRHVDVPRLEEERARGGATYVNSDYDIVPSTYLYGSN